MRDVNSKKISFIEFLKKDWVIEYAKRILFAVLVLLVINYAVGYVGTLPVKVDPNDIITMNCSVTDKEIVLNIKEWEKGKEPEMKYDSLKYRYDEVKRTLFVSLILSNDGSDKPYKEYPIKNTFKNLKRVAIEGGILNVHQKTIWYDGEETIAVKPSPSPANSQRNR
ncbi:MAG: hypothetical protein J6M16_01130 [Clostridia bacterium]|nr:hypothetical protein [Clostridia bacterium]